MSHQSPLTDTPAPNAYIADSAPPAPPVTPATQESPREPWLNRQFELVIAILLGVASVITAWASFQASLYDGEMAKANTEASVLAAEAESLYLEGNQQYMRDGQLFDRFTELNIQAGSSDAETAALADQTIEVLSFQSLTEDFAAALEWSVAENDADPETFTHPQSSQDYLDALFGGYTEVKQQATAAIDRSGAYNDLGDQLTLATVLLAISLFLFGVSAILRSLRMRLIITGVSTVVMVVATVMSVIVVSTPVG